MKPSRPVPCGNCTACCHEELILLHPEDGDRPETYLTRSVVSPLSGKVGLALNQRPDGACIYLGATGCTIYDRRPAICRTFDCRRFLALMRTKLKPRDLQRTIACTPVLLAAQRAEQASAPAILA